MVVAAVLAVGWIRYYFLNSGGITELADADATEEDEDEDEGEPRTTPYYFSLNPVFVVNFVGRWQTRFLQVNVEGPTRDSSIKKHITTHLLQIRNNIVLLMNSKIYDDLITAEGKELLRKEVLTELKKILRKETGNDEIEDVYFTSFVMQ